MKILVSDEAKKALVSGFGFKPETVVLQSGRVKMLKAAAAAKVYDEGVIVVGKFAKDLVRLLRRSLRDLLPAFEVVVALAGHYDPVLFALDVKRYLFEIADLERRIVKNVKILGPKCVCLARDLGQSRRDPPFAKRNYLNGRRNA